MQNLAQVCANSVCPVCGMPIDEQLIPSVAAVTDDEHGDRVVRIGACGHAHAEMIARDPLAFATHAENNETSSSSFSDG